MLVAVVKYCQARHIFDRRDIFSACEASVARGVFRGDVAREAKHLSVKWQQLNDARFDVAVELEDQCAGK